MRNLFEPRIDLLLQLLLLFLLFVGQFETIAEGGRQNLAELRRGAEAARSATPRVLARLLELLFLLVAEELVEFAIDFLLHFGQLFFLVVAKLQHFLEEGRNELARLGSSAEPAGAARPRPTSAARPRATSAARPRATSAAKAS